MYWQQAWSEFTKTGSISDYLEYSNSYKTPDVFSQEMENNADKNNRNSDKGKEYR